MLLLYLAFLASLVYLVHEIRRRRAAFALRASLGLNGPPTDFLTGNISFLIKNIRRLGREATTRSMQVLCGSFGKTFGFYVGTQLHIITSEPEFVREIFISQFSNFMEREWVDFNRVYPLVDSLLQVGQSGTHGTGWKEIRSTVSAVFTSGKLKKMHGMFRDQLAELVTTMREKAAAARGTIDIYAEYQAITMDMIARCALGLDDLSCIRDRENVFYRRARAVVTNFSYDKCLVFVLTFIFPWTRHFRRFSSIGIPENQIVADLSDVIHRREKERAVGMTRPLPDIIDLILEENEQRIEKGAEPLHHDVIVSNCYVMFMAGYETTSTALSYATWLLAKHPDCQEKLYEEVVETFGLDENIDYERVMKLPYMHAVFSESLRLYPPVTTFTSRRATRDTLLAGRLRVPAGTNVTVPVHVVHWEEANWPDPDLFLPERFFYDAKPTTSSPIYLPFGIGPRNCVGARFAEMEFKTVLAEVVRRFIIDVDPSQAELKTTITSILLQPSNNELLVKLQERYM